MSVTICPAVRPGTAAAPCVNFNQVDGHRMLVTLGIVQRDDPYWMGGSIDIGATIELIDRIVDFLRTDAVGMTLRAPLLRDRAGEGERFATFASDEEAALRRLRDLNNVARWAVERGVGLTWS